MKLMTIHNITFSLVFFISLQLHSQQVWTLTQCIKQGVSNNIRLNISENKLKKQKINLYESKASLFPSINIGSGFNTNFGRNIDGSTNTITFDKTLSNTYWINTYIDLFQGFTKINTIKFNKYVMLAVQQETEQEKNKLIFDIITNYYVSVYSLGLEKMAINQVKLSELQYTRMQKMVSVGKESPIVVQDLKCQWMNDQLQLQIAENNSKKQLTKLKELLQLQSVHKFILDTTNQAVLTHKFSSLRIIYQSALTALPQIKQQQYLLKASQKKLAIAKGKVLPNLYLLAGMNSYYFDKNKMSFQNQIDNNQNQFISFGLQIPVFNGAKVHSDIKRRKIELNDQILQIENQKERLFAQIQEVYTNVQAAKSEYKSTIELYKFNQLSLKNVKKKLEKGLASTTDFEVVKQRLFKAQVTMIKAKFSYVMYAQILQFYQTGNWNHLKI